nr:cytochrome b6/f complex subunit VI [Herpetospermum pedunculosum]
MPTITSYFGFLLAASNSFL